MRKNRVIEQDRCYHLISRLAHRAFFLDDEEKDRAVALMRRVEEFSGVVVLAYAFMSNHFHIFIYVPKAEDIGEDEILRRICVLYHDASLVAKLRPRVEKLVRFFEAYENADGLLEKLPAWVFVEWSKANTFVQDVNYPSNMAYAGMLDAVARLYGRADLAAKAARVRRTVKEQSFDGRFFRDHAVRVADGRLEVRPDVTETCQYYAFYFGVASFETDGALWRRLLDDCGPVRKVLERYPDVGPSNAFIGNYLRLELLSRAGLPERIDRESRGFFTYMAERTGTLWEHDSHDSTAASCCHGFAAHVAVLIDRDLKKMKAP